MRKQLIPLLAASLTVASLFASPGAALANPSFVFDATGYNTLDISDFTVAIYASNVFSSKFGASTIKTGTTYSFPIIGGGVDAENIILEAVSVGGVKFKNETSVVTMSSPIVNTTADQPVMTFLVTVNGNLQGRYDMFNLKVPKYAKPQALAVGDAFQAGNMTASLTQAGANILNNTFHTALINGTPVGTVKVKGVIGQQLPK
jgi:hypothetical protein